MPFSPNFTSDYGFRGLISRLHKIMDDYYGRVLEDYERAGLLVDWQNGRFRVKGAYKKRDPATDGEYYHASSDRRKLRDYVTAHRDLEGISYEARLFEELINQPETTETSIQEFMEQHPAFLMDAMHTIPSGHDPRFQEPRGWTPDFTGAPAASTPRTKRVAHVAELKGPNVPLLAGKQHRGFSQHVMKAINQIRDYDRLIKESGPANLKAIIERFGYVPDETRLAVLIGRSPRDPEDSEILKRRMSEQADVRIVNYDEILQVQHDQLIADRDSSPNVN